MFGANALLFVGYTVASVAGLLLIKARLPQAYQLWKTDGQIGLPLLIGSVGVGLYVTSFAIWLVILSRNDLSVAYPAAIGLTLVFSTVAAGLLLGEPLSLQRVLGIAVVFAGIWIVTRP